MAEDRSDLLIDARDRTGKVLNDLRQRLTDLESNRLSQLQPEELEAGRRALQRAIASTERTIESLQNVIEHRAPGEQPENNA